ncbi:MAG: NAD-dependent epimerase/dehydratase family protein [Thermodesulfobacteriota bacterium]
MFANKNVLISGGNGFIGSNLVRRLLAEGANVRATIHRHEPVINDESIEYIRCDLTKGEDCAKACRHMDYVFMCAAVTSGASVMEKTPLVHLTPNLIMNARLLEAAYEAQVKKILFISSNTVYPVSEFPVKEEDVTNEFFHKYFIVAWMKRFSEIMCDMYSNKISRPMHAVVVRPANVYGPYDDFDWETSHVLPALIRRVVERHDPIKIWGDGNDVKDFIYVDDLVSGLLLAMDRLHGYEPINIASGKGYKLRDLLHMIIGLDGYQDAVVEYDTSKPTMIPFRVLDTSKAEKKIGFRAMVPIEDGLRRTIEWYRSTL